MTKDFLLHPKFQRHSHNAFKSLDIVDPLYHCQYTEKIWKTLAYISSRLKIFFAFKQLITIN